VTEQWKRRAYMTAGWLFVALATLGVFLPLLPTTPFVLLASSCFVRCSPRARRWLHESRLFGPSLRDWEEHRAIRRPVKVLALVMCSTVIALTFIREMHWGLRAAIIAVGAVGIIVVARLPVIDRTHPTRQPRLNK
jgi:uncharacterized membrane protein YbaN (DUF454 family)